MAYQDWLRATSQASTPGCSQASFRNALLISVLMLPIAVVHHLAPHPIGDLLVVVLSALLVIAFAVWLTKEGTDRETGH